MRSAGRATASHPRRRSCLVATLVAQVLVLIAWRAQAEVALVPSRDGFLGAWLVAGPLSPHVRDRLRFDQLDPRSGSRVMRARWAPTWRVLASRTGAIDVRRQLHTATQARGYALLGGILHLEEDLEGWLMVAADGGIAVFADGQILFDRDVPRLRDRSWDPIPIELGAGDHSIVLRLHQRGQHWAVAVRLLDGRDLLPPAGAALRLPGTTERQAHLLMGQLRTVECGVELLTAGYRPSCNVEYLRGAPREASLPVEIRARTVGIRSPLFEVRLGAVGVTAHGVQPLRATLPTVLPAQLGSQQLSTVDLRSRVGTEEVTSRLWLAPSAPRLLGDARRSVDALGKDGNHRLLDSAAVADTLDWYRARLELAASDGARGRERTHRALSDLERFVAPLRQGQDPLRRPGIVDVAPRSELDGRPAQLRVHIPASYSPTAARRYPLVVLLHGYNGSPEGIMRAFLDTASRAPHPSVDGFVVAPNAHGNSFYRGPGEHAVLAAVDWMLHTYPIDPDRVSISGVSMGGTGTAEIGLRHAGRFAAAAPLCGYHSFFVRRDTSNRPLRPWEKERMHHWSPASFADNGRHLPLYVAHGTRDHPLENSRVLVRAYQQAGYSIVADWPDTGHSVWKKTYAGARLWPWLTRHRRDRAPRHVTFRTDTLRDGTLDWVRVTALARPGHRGRVDARVTAAGTIAVTTEAVAGLALERPAPHVPADQALSLRIDGDRLGFAPGEAIRVDRRSGHWQKTKEPSPRNHKRAGVEGPIRDVFRGPVLFVYGTLDPRTLRANREIAETMAELRYRVDVRYPVVADRQVTERLEATHSLFLVGNARDHLILRRIDARLPIRVTSDGIRLGDHTLPGSGLGTLFIHPNPDQPDRYVVALEATDLIGLYASLSLPRLLPDFVVFDPRVAPSAGEQVLTAGSVRAAGFFENDWSLPAATADPYSSKDK